MTAEENRTSFNPLKSIWVVSILCLTVIMIPLLIVFNENNVTLLGIQIFVSAIILIAQQISSRRMFEKCAVCHHERVFHDRKKYPYFSPIICSNFSKSGR